MSARACGLARSNPRTTGYEKSPTGFVAKERDHEFCKGDTWRKPVEMQGGGMHCRARVPRFEQKGTLSPVGSGPLTR
ncbi:hypothetical protein [Mesorhizobium argentiipisi]|uniref:Uncharacterized protein n=1 Tax=Mesorhizobium argentiipisi TaxID=3015175 RepID=A0ABU8K9X1_9HYPH